MPETSKISIITLVVYFLVYIGIHYFIGLKKNKLEEELLEKPKDEMLTKEYNTWVSIFQWFPAIYIIIIILLMVL